MKTVVVGILLIALARHAAADPSAASASPSDPAPAAEVSGDSSEDKAMARWVEFSAPGKPHEMLSRMAGKWQVAMKTWMGDADAPPATAQGTAEFELILGGRYLRQTYQSEFMGKPFEGVGIEGYDNFRKQYTSVWMDNMSTATAVMHGQCDEVAKSCTYYGNMDNPMTSEIGKLVRATCHWTGDKSTFAMFEATAEGGWKRTMESVYSRMK